MLKGEGTLRAKIGFILAFALVLMLPIFATHINGAGQPPISHFVYSPTTPGPEEAIMFDASASYDDWRIVNYTWDFGDGSIVTVATPVITYSYPVDGNYTVQLTVTDDEGLTGVSSTVVEVQCIAFFRVISLTGAPLQGVEVTVYYRQGSSWTKAPTGSSGVEIKYDNMTQPNLANTTQQKYRNPGYTASILRQNASNIGFDLHKGSWTVYFKFQWAIYTSYWPNDTTRVYTYSNGTAEPHDYLSGHRAYWDATAGTYVINVNDIQEDGVNPTESHPIIVSLRCPIPPPQYYLTVRTSPTGTTTIPGEGLYNNGTSATLTAPQTVDSSPGTRYRFDYWDVDGTSKGTGVNPITVTMTANHTATAHYCLQYSVVFNYTGLDSSASGTVVTVNGNSKVLGDLPYTLWVDSGSSVTYSYGSTVSSSTSGKQFRLTGVTGSSSPITVSSPKTATGNYVVQYLITFAQTGLDSTATGTVVTVNGSAKTYGNMPFSWWVDSGSIVTYSYNSIVSSTTSGKQFRLTSVNCPPSQFVVTEPTTITGNYCTQYLVTFGQSGLDSTATGTVVTVNGSVRTFSGLPYSFWVDSGGSVTYSYNSPVSTSYSDKRFRLNTVTGPTSPFTVTGPTTVTGNYVTQYLLTFTQTGLDSSATGTVVTANGNTKVFGDLPYTAWFDSGSSVTYSYTSTVSSSTGGKRFRLNTVGGPSSPITVSGSTTVTGNYVAQYSVTFTHTGLALDAVGTVVVVDGTAKAFGDLPYVLWVDSGLSVTYSYSSTVSSSISGKQFRLSSVSGSSSPITVTASTTITGNYVTQYLVTFTQTGLDSSATGTVVTVNGNAKTYSNLPYGLWVDSGSSVTYSYSSIVSSTTSGKQFRLNTTSGSTSPITVSGPTTVTGNYVIQYLVTFTHSGLDSSASGTVVTVNGNAKTYGNLPYTAWFDSGSSVIYSYNSIVTSSTGGKQFKLNSITGPSSPITVSGPTTVTGNYLTQYLATFNHTGLDSSASGTIVTVNGNAETFTDLPYTLWVDSGSPVTYSYGNVSSSTIGKRFILTGTTGPSSPITVTSPTTVTGNFKTQYSVTFDQTGAGTDYTGTVITVDGANYNTAGLPAQFWWDQGSGHSFAFASPLTVNATKQYSWSSTTGLSNLQSGTLTITTSGSLTGNYVIQSCVTFDQQGVSAGFSGTVLIIDGNSYGVSALPVSFYWQLGSTHSFAFQSPLIVTANSKQNLWTSTTGLSTLQSGSINVTSFGSIVGHYKTQYYVTLAANPPGLGNQSGSAWYDDGAYVSISTDQYVPGGSRWRFVGWTTTDMSEISDPTSPSTTVLIDKAKTVTANYVHQYYITFTQSGLASDASGTIVTVNATAVAYSSLPYSIWVDTGDILNYLYTTTVASTTSGKQYSLTSVTGPSSPMTVSADTDLTGNYKTQYYLSVSSPYGTPGGQGWYDSGATAHATLDVGLVDHGNGTRHVFTNWNGDGSGTNYAQSNQITMNGAKVATANWKTQHRITFTHSGLDPSASGTVVTVNSIAKTYGDLPYYLWTDNGASATYAYGDVSSSTPGKRFVLTGVTGSASPITVTSPATVTGDYKIQYQITFNQTGASSDFTGTVVTVDSTGYTVSSLSVSFWWDSGSSHAFAFQSPLVVAVNTKQYLWTSTTGLSTAQSGSITALGSGTVMGNYKTQYYLGVSSSYGTTGGQGWYDSGATAYATLNVGMIDHGNGTKHAFMAWSGDASGTNYAQSNPITMSGAKTATANWKTQYSTAFTQSGLDSSASGTIVTVNGTSITFSGLPYNTWTDAGDTLTYSYTNNVSSTTLGEVFTLTGVSGPGSPITVTGVTTITGSYKAQYQVTLSQTGVSSDFAGTIVTIDGTGYTGNMLPAVFWWDSNSTHTFSFASPLTVNASRQYNWTSTTGLSALQSGNLTIAGSGSIIGNYVSESKYQITFSQTGVGSGFTGTILIIDESNYNNLGLPVSFWWDAGSTHAFAFQSPLIASPNIKRYVWTNTSGPWPSQSGSITVSASATVTGNYKIQYYLAMATNPSSITTPTGTGWYDSGSLPTISTPAFVDITPYSSRYRFNGWTTPDMVEITDPTSSPTTVLMDKGKTVTAIYAKQYNVTFKQSGINSDFTGTILTIDGRDYNFTGLPVSFWWDDGSIHSFAYQSPLLITPNAKQYVWISTTGLSTQQSGLITVTSSDDPIGNYKTQYYLSVSSPYGTPGGQGWYDSGATAHATLNTGLHDYGTGTRRVFTGWGGDASGTNYAQSNPITMNGPKNAAANWKTQYHLTVIVSPSGAPGIPGDGWYDIGANVPLTAPPAPGYTFFEWRLDGISQGINVTSINVMMNAAHYATAYYSQIQQPGGGTPVGGYSFLPTNAASPVHLIAYFALVTMLGLAINLLKRKRK